MSRLFVALTCIVLAVGAWFFCQQIRPAQPAVRVIAPITTTTADWRPYVHAVAHAQHQRQLEYEAIRYAVALQRSVPPARVASRPRVYLRVGTGCAYASLIRSIWQRDAEWAIGIAWRESRCIPTAYNPSGAEGLFQLLGHGDLMAGCSWSDPACNTRAAWRLYEGSGRRPWAL